MENDYPNILKYSVDILYFLVPIVGMFLNFYVIKKLRVIARCAYFFELKIFKASFFISLFIN